MVPAYRLLWLAVAFNVLGFGISFFEWDRSWRATHAFEDFSSPRLRGSSSA
jgi:hypothetical protein